MIKTFNEVYLEYCEKNSVDEKVIYFNDVELTLGDLQQRVDEIMRQLIRLGVVEGTGVGYSLDNCIDILPLFIAISRIGAYGFPLFPGFTSLYKMESYQKAGISLVITNEAYVEELQKTAQEIQYQAKFSVVEASNRYESIMGDTEDLIDIDSYLIDVKNMDIPLMIGISSGTTGIPKMVAMSQKNIGSEIIVMMDMEKNSMEKLGDSDHKRIVAFPLSTSVVLVLYGILFQNISICFTDNMRPMHFLECAEKWKVNGITCPPAYLESILLLKDNLKYDLSRIATIEGGMDFFSPSLIRRIRTILPGLRVYGGGYGLVETCNVYMFKVMDITREDIEDTARYELSKDAENVIKVCDKLGKEVACGEIGEVYVKGPNVVTGYITSPGNIKESFPDGWLHTGDIARKINERTINMLGREKYFIKRGGKSVSPIVVQSEINKTEGVKDSAVVGVPHPLYGEMIWAFVVKKDDISLTLKDIKKTCKKNLPYYMQPDQITFIEDIPKKQGVGKVNYDLIREMGKEVLKKITSSAQ